MRQDYQLLKNRWSFHQHVLPYMNVAQNCKKRFSQNLTDLKAGSLIAPKQKIFFSYCMRPLTLPTKQLQKFIFFGAIWLSLELTVNYIKARLTAPRCEYIRVNACVCVCVLAHTAGYLIIDPCVQHYLHVYKYTHIQVNTHTAGGHLKIDLCLQHHLHEHIWA